MGSPTTEADALRGLYHGRWRAEVVRTMLALGLPESLATRSATAAELAERLDVDADGLARLLTVAAGLGMCDDLGAGRFAANPATELLRADHPRSMRTEVLHALSDWSGVAWDNLGYAVRTGTSGFRQATGMSVFEFLAGRPDEAANFHAFQAQVTRRNAAALLAGYRFPATGTIVDVGGGTGALVIEILRHEPGLRGVVLDQPDVVPECRPPVDIADRFDVVAGDFFASVPSAARVYLLSHVLHDWPDTAAIMLLRRVREAMVGESELVILEIVRDDQQSGLLVTYLDVLMLTAWAGRERSIAEYAELLDSAGFAAPATCSLDRRSGLTALVVCAAPLS